MISLIVFQLATAIGCLLLALLFPELVPVALATVIVLVALCCLCMIGMVLCDTGKPEQPSLGKSQSTSTLKFRERHYFIGGSASVPLNQPEQEVWLSLKTSYLRSEWMDICRAVQLAEQNYLVASQHLSPRQLGILRSSFGSTRMKQDAAALKLCGDNSRLSTQTCGFFSLLQTPSVSVTP